MKHLYYFKENNESNLEQTNNDFTILFENENWLIEKANSVDALLNWAEEGDINMNSYKSNFSNIFLNTNKKTDDKIVFDFYRSDFYTLEDDNIDLKETIDNNIELLKFYGETLICENVVKIENDYWMIVNDYTFFEDYFKIDNKTRSDLIPMILSGDLSGLFDYDQSSFNIEDSNINLNNNNLDYIKIIITLESIIYNYDIDIDDIDDYSDAVDIIKEYDMGELKDVLLNCIRSAHETADQDAAWTDIIDNAYSFFNLLKNSLKWDFYNNSKNEMLWLKFESEIDAYKAKFTINKYDDSYVDNMIDYSPPYYGYSGNSKSINDAFNEIFTDKIYEYYNNDISSEDIDKSYDILKKEKEINQNIKISDIINDIKMHLDTKKFNI